MTVAELLERMSAYEIMQWGVLFEIEYQEEQDEIEKAKNENR